jgi:hypothetical protein
LSLLAPSLISLFNCSAVETCIFVEVGTAIKDLEFMKIADMEVLFFNKCVALVRSIPNDLFLDDSVHVSMLEKYVGAKKPNTGWSLLHKYKKDVGEICKFGHHFPGIKCMSKLLSGTTQLLQIKGAMIIELWKSVNTVSSLNLSLSIFNLLYLFCLI